MIIHLQEKDGISKRIAAEESALEQLRAKLHAVLQEAKVEQVALPLVGGGTLGGGGGRGRKRSRREGEEEDEEDQESEEVGRPCLSFAFCPLFNLIVSDLM